MPNESRDHNDNPYESPKSVGANPTSGSPTLWIVAIIFLSIATLIAVPIVFLTVCVTVAIAANHSGPTWFGLTLGVSLATLAAGLMIYGMIRLSIWMLKPRRPIQ